MQSDASFAEDAQQRVEQSIFAAVGSRQYALYALRTHRLRRLPQLTGARYARELHSSIDIDSLGASRKMEGEGARTRDKHPLAVQINLRKVRISSARSRARSASRRVELKTWLSALSTTRSFT